MAKKPAKVVRTQMACDQLKTRIVSRGRWYERLYGRTDRELDEKQEAFFREWDERRGRWRTDYRIELPTNVDQWERLLSRVGLSPQDTSRILSDIPDISLVINHVEGYLDRARDSTGAVDADAPASRLPKLKAHDRQAWQLATLHGMTQDKVAAELNRVHGTTYTQGQVSRMIARAKAHAEANGLTEKVAGPIDRPRTVDPGRLELGARVDKRKPRPSDMARANDDDE